MDKYSSDVEQTQILSDRFDDQILKLIESKLVMLAEGGSRAVSVDELADVTQIRPRVLLENLVKMQLRKKVKLSRSSETQSIKDIYVELP